MLCGAAKDDESHFGLRDMAGNGLEWTRRVADDGDLSRRDQEVPLRRPRKPKDPENAENKSEWAAYRAGMKNLREKVVILRGRSVGMTSPFMFKHLNDELDFPGARPYLLEFPEKTSTEVGFRVVIEFDPPRS
jgi:hypothetical protein